MSLCRPLTARAGDRQGAQPPRQRLRSNCRGSCVFPKCAAIGIPTNTLEGQPSAGGRGTRTPHDRARNRTHVWLTSPVRKLADLFFTHSLKWPPDNHNSSLGQKFLFRIKRIRKSVFGRCSATGSRCPPPSGDRRHSLLGAARGPQLTTAWIPRSPSHAQRGPRGGHTRHAGRPTFGRRPGHTYAPRPDSDSYGLVPNESGPEACGSLVHTL